MANETWLDGLNPLKITEDAKVKDSFINTFSKIHKKSIDETTMVYEKESMYFKKALLGSDKLQKSTKISLYSAFIEIAIQGISIQPGQKSEAYMEARGVNIGTRQDPKYVDTAMLRITTYGELNMRISAGQIIRMKNPIVLYEGDYFQPLTNQRGELYVDYKPAIPRKSQKIYGAWVCIELPGNSLDFKWILEDDIKRLKGYSAKQSSANALYTADNGQIDPGFLEAKTIKHAMRAYTKLRVSDIAAFEGEELEEGKETPEPFGETPAPIIKDTVKVDIKPDEPFLIKYNMENQSTDLALTNEELAAQNVKKLVEIVQTAPAILKDSKTRHDKAIAYGNNLLDKAEENGMSDDLDALMADYQGKLRVTHKTIYDARRPFTQIVDEVKKEFTSLESDIDPAGKTNIFFKIQGIRNIFVTDKVAAQKKKDAEVIRLQNIEKEKIEIERQVTIAINESFGTYLSGVKKAMNNIFEGMQLNSVESTRKMITATPLSLSKTIFDTFAKGHFFVNFITPEQVNEMVAAKKTESLLADLNDVCTTDLMEYRRELIEKIPSKQKELEAIANAGKEEAERLEKEVKVRQDLEAKRLQAEAEQKALIASQNAAVEAAGKTFEATIATQAQLFGNEAPKTKDGYLIEIIHKAGYGLLFQFWFEKEGRSLTADKIEKKTIGQMKTFCEAYAIKNDEKIVSPLLKYTETYKAK